VALNESATETCGKELKTFIFVEQKNTLLS
jgi:hypothetical protein